MDKTVFITGATDGIGLATAKKIAALGHQILIHGRNEDKLKRTADELNRVSSRPVNAFLADLSNLNETGALAAKLCVEHPKLDVIINNAGVLKTRSTHTQSGHDLRFVVNTFAPVQLTKALLPLMNPEGRVINLSSAAQSSVNPEVLHGTRQLSNDLEVYAQSKLALTMWSRQLGQKLGDDGPVILAINPGSLLASNMVKTGFGMEGKDINIGADILVEAALADSFRGATGLYYDNDNQCFSEPHEDALDPIKCKAIVSEIERALAKLGF